VKFIVNDQMVLLRAPEGPLAPYISSFSEWVIGQGYAQCSLRQRVRIAAGFSRWLAAKSVPLNGVTYQHSLQYLRYRARRQRVCEDDATALRQFLDFLRNQGAIQEEKRPQRQLPCRTMCSGI
jgi:integrase/recombinase XerD